MGKAVDVKLIVRQIRSSVPNEPPGDPYAGGPISGVTWEALVKSYLNSGYDVKEVFDLGLVQPEGYLNLAIVLVKYEANTEVGG